MGWDKTRERTTKATGPIAWGLAPALGVHSVLKPKIYPLVDKLLTLQSLSFLHLYSRNDNITCLSDGWGEGMEDYMKSCISNA